MVRSLQFLPIITYLSILISGASAYNFDFLKDNQYSQDAKDIASDSIYNPNPILKELLQESSEWIIIDRKKRAIEDRAVKPESNPYNNPPPPPAQVPPQSGPPPGPPTAEDGADATSSAGAAASTGNSAWPTPSTTGNAPQGPLKVPTTNAPSSSSSSSSPSSSSSLASFTMPSLAPQDFAVNTPLEINNHNVMLLKDYQPYFQVLPQNTSQYYIFEVNSSTGVGSNYELLIFLSGNIKSEPNNTDVNDPKMTIDYTLDADFFSDNFNLTANARNVEFIDGYFEGLQIFDPQDWQSQLPNYLYMKVQTPPNADETAFWNYSIGVSQSDLVFQWDNRTWASVLDTDDSSALIVTGNLTTDSNWNISDLDAPSEAFYRLKIYPLSFESYFDNLGYSWYAISTGPEFDENLNYNTTFTQRFGELQQQFYVTGLNESTTYIAYMYITYSSSQPDGSSAGQGGTVYSQFQFTTKANDGCELIFDLPFCDKIAYAVPRGSHDSADLISLYDDNAKAMYENFTFALQQIACDTTNDAVFSPVSSCSMCAEAYKNWLCAVTIPRCSTNDNVTGYKYRPVGESRNDFIDTEIQPIRDYYEVLPCFNMCEAIVRACPAVFNFACPTKNDSISKSYFWDVDNDLQNPTCNYIGDTTAWSAGGKLEAGWKLLGVMALLYFI